MRAAEILPPDIDDPDPQDQAPAASRVTRDQYEKKIDDRRQKQREKQEKNPELKEEQKTEKSTPVEPPEPHPNVYGAALSLVGSSIAVSGNREDYVTDISGHFNFFWRVTGEKPNKWNLWTGARLASFTGTGTQAGYRGRFGFLYFGPMIGVGRLGVKDPDAAELELKWMFAAQAGIAGCSRSTTQTTISQSEASEDATDFKRTQIPFDSPGLWAEMRAGYFISKRSSLGFMGGIQLGEGKVISYAGLEFGLWH